MINFYKSMVLKRAFSLSLIFLMFLAAKAQKPSIISFSPSSGNIGTLVTIQGSNLNNLTSLKIGGVSAIPISNTGNSIVAMVMPNASTGLISIITPGGSANSLVSFNVTVNQTVELTQQGGKLTGGGTIGAANHGCAISVSADGNTAIVGGYGDDSIAGAAWIYTRKDGAWSQQGVKLVGTGAIKGTEGTGQGFAVSISADGNTAIVGGPGDNNFAGAAWIFTRKGSVWSQQGSKLVGTGAINGSDGAFQGNSVSISADGNTAIIGGPGDNNYAGAVWVFTRNGSVWSQQGSKLVGTGAINGSTGAFQGVSVSISADGNTAIAGGDGDNNFAGAVWVFTRNGSVWSQQGSKLVGTGAVGAASQGGSVSISADGNTAIVGAADDNNATGAVWIFTRNGSLWSQQGSKLVGTDAVGSARQGNSVSISADGNTVMIGGYNDNATNNNGGAGWVFTRNGTFWSQQGSKLIGKGAIGFARQGYAVSLSADGNTAFIGGDGDNNEVGAVWVFGVPQPPIITSFSPSSGSVGSLITIYGANLENVTALTIGSVAAIPISTQGNSMVVMVMPYTVNGPISITTAGGTVNSSSNFSVTVNKVGPNSQQGNKLVSNNAANGLYGASQGRAVSISADGNTAIVGGYYDNDGVGAAWIYTRTNGLWSQQGSKLVGTDAIGDALQGMSVGISADGNTAIIGGYGDNSLAGAAWVFTRNGSVWSQQGSKLVGTGAIGAARQGYAVSLSADGNTAIIGGYGDNGFAGAAWIFTRNGSVWSQQGSKLVGWDSVGAARQGWSVSISADGNTVIIGGQRDNTNAGAAWVFTRNGGFWSQQGSKLVGTGAVGAARQGYAVSLSADGNTAIVGGYSDNNFTGAVWVFTRSRGSWRQQGNKLVGTDGSNGAYQGNSVSLSADGNTAIVGGYGDNYSLGAAWVFMRNGSVWSQQGNKLIGSGAIDTAWQGTCVSISADGNTAIVGGENDNKGIGAAWIFQAVDNPLPLTLVSFNAHVTSYKAVQLNWQTANELNTSHFVIQHSNNGTVFKKVGFVSAIDSGAHAYDFVHNQAANGKNYYRLQILDKDGKYSFSNVETVVVDSLHSLSVYPNPAKDRVTLQFKPSSENAKVVVLSLTGKIVYNGVVDMQQGYATIPLHNIAKGVYSLQVITNNQKQVHTLVVDK